MTIPTPLGLLAELTHRCPLQCPYCSNPIDLVRAERELTTAQWTKVFHEAADLGILHVHLSGGEPMARADIFELTSAAAAAGLYTNMITSAVTLDADKVARLKVAGLDHVQISVQGVATQNADRIANMSAAAARKAAAAALVKAAGIALTVNAPLHRQNIDEAEALIDLALAWGAERLELAHIQYYGWGLANRAALMPTRRDVDRVTAMVENARRAHAGRLVIDYVTPDYYADRPKACMGGWGRQVIVVAPDGRALPCHAAATLPDLIFENVRERALRDIWHQSSAFALYRGTGWMPAPCQGCDRAEIDWGGCRCQAFALTGNAAATDPACSLSPDHDRLSQATSEAASEPPHLRYRRFGG